MNNSRNYLLVTACKNEGENLPDLIDSVIGQTVQPIVWVIVDDGSTDNTPQITKSVTKKYNWIHVLRIGEGKRDLGLHYANIVKMGFDHAILHCKKMRFEYNYAGNLDGDLTLEHTFFENLMREFENDIELGIASGGTKHIIGDFIIHAKVSIDEPSGGHMLIRRECFEGCGEIPLSYSIDSVLKAKARNRNWKTRRFENNIATEVRDVHAAEGYWKGFVHKGEASYFLFVNPLHVFLGVILYSIRGPYYAGIAYLVGYLYSAIQKSERTKDMEIRRYFWNKWKRRVKLYGFFK